jgi:hypothetical protein
LHFGVVRPETLVALQKEYGNFSLAVFGSTLLLLVLAVISCLLAMWHRRVPLSGISLAAHQEAVDIVSEFPVGSIDDELTSFYRKNQIELWRAAAKERARVNSFKSGCVLIAQIRLGAGIVAATLNILLMGVQVWRFNDGKLLKNQLRKLNRGR